MVLAAHLRKIGHAGKGLTGRHRTAVKRGQHLGAREMLDDLGDGRDRIHGHVFHDGRFPGILDRHEQPLDASTAAGQRHGERAVDRLDTALQGDFAHHHELPQDRRRDEPFRRQDAHGDGQIKRGAFLAEGGRGQVDGDFSLGKAETAVAQRRTDPLATFPHRQVRKSDHREHG